MTTLGTPLSPNATKVMLLGSGELGNAWASKPLPSIVIRMRQVTRLRTMPERWS